MKIDIVITVNISIVYEAPKPEQPVESTAKNLVAKCNVCGWRKTYTTEDAANRGLAAHQARWCPGPTDDPLQRWIDMMLP